MKRRNGKLTITPCLLVGTAQKIDDNGGLVSTVGMTVNGTKRPGSKAGTGGNYEWRE